MSFDPAGTVFEMHSEKPQINLEMKDVNCTFDFKYNITTDPEFIQDIGSGTIEVINLSPKLSGSPRVMIDSNSHEKAHRIDIDHVELSSEGFDVTLDGGDIAFIVSGFSDTYTEYIR